MGFHSNYWSCSKLADRIRGNKKPNFATSKGWKEWQKQAEAQHPVRFWIADELLDHIQDVIFWLPNKIDSIRYYLNNWLIIKTHALVAHPRDIKRGQYSELGMQILPCLFNSLVDHIEIRRAWMNVVWDDDARKKYGLNWWNRRPYNWFRVWRSATAGLAHLDWESTLVWKEDGGIVPGHELYGKLTHQAHAAIEMKELYHWWTNVRPNRIDPHDVSGWSDICEKRRKTDPGLFMFEDNTDAERTETMSSLERLRKIEEQYEQEDEDMLIRLIKIRQSLWT